MDPWGSNAKVAENYTIAMDSLEAVHAAAAAGAVVVVVGIAAVDTYDKHVAAVASPFQGHIDRHRKVQEV